MFHLKKYIHSRVIVKRVYQLALQDTSYGVLVDEKLMGKMKIRLFLFSVLSFQLLDRRIEEKTTRRCMFAAILQTMLNSILAWNVFNIK